MRTYPKGSVKSKITHWAVDFDYLDQLDKKARRWLVKFVDEYYSGYCKKNKHNRLHRSAALRKECYARNNRNKRDIFSRLQAINGLFMNGFTSEC